MAKEKSNATATVPTPIAIIWDKVLMLPVTDTIDSKRAQQIMEAILTKISEVEAKVVILDILGVATVDSAVANHLIKITKATRLMGCTSIITGISPTISQILVHLGVELRDVITRSTLRDGLEIAFSALNLEVREIKEPTRRKGGLITIGPSLAR